MDGDMSRGGGEGSMDATNTCGWEVGGSVDFDTNGRGVGGGGIVDGDTSGGGGGGIVDGDTSGGGGGGWYRHIWRRSNRIGGWCSHIMWRIRRMRRRSSMWWSRGCGSSCG
jgi:hypothetical protein